jgi:transcriptional regulator with XRE-family HTH domain
MSELNLARLRSARERHGLTQIELSRLLGVTQTLAGQWERGYKDPSLANLKELSRALRVSLPWLLGMDETSPTIADDPSASASGLPPVPRRPRYTSAAEILADYDAPIGLRDLAQAREMTQAQRITAEEWTALGSLDFPGGLTIDGYCGLLVMLRTAAQHGPRQGLEQRPGRKVGGVRSA